MKLIFAMQKAAALKDRHSKGSLRYYSNYQPDYLYVTAVSYTHLDVYKRQPQRTGQDTERVPDTGREQAECVPGVGCGQDGM